MKNAPRAVIVGGGLGGLGAALRLSAAGWHVTICEATPTFGGKMNRWDGAGYTFDTGPSLITMPWVFAELYAAAGARLEDHLELVRIDPLATCVFDDGTRFEYGASLPAWLETIRSLEPRDEDGFWQFMRLGARIFELSRDTFFRRGPLEPPDWRALRALRRAPLRRAWGSYHRTVEAHFRSPHLRQLYNRYPTYVGSSPYLSPATLAVIPYIEVAFGGWHVRGGLYRIVESLVNLARSAGVELLADAPVERIEQNGGRVSGVEIRGGRRIAADVVVMNGDASTAAALLDSAAPPLPVGARSLSGLVLLFALRAPLPEAPHHAVYFSADYRREFDDLFERQVFPSDPTVYVNVASRTDRSVALPGGETLFIMANAPATDREWSRADLERAQLRIFERLQRGGFPAIQTGIVAQDVWTPGRFAQQYRAPGGAIYGSHSHGWRRAFLRPSNRDPRVRGLYYVGGSTHPGGGTPTVLMSARIACDLIARSERV